MGVEHKSRSWAKSITWRIVGILILGGISYLFTRDMAKVTWITLIFHSIRLVLYYWHERLWERIAWGRKRHPLDSFAMKEDLTQEDIEQIRRVLDEKGYLMKRPEYEI